MNTLSLKQPDSLHRTVKSFAAENGVSVNQFISLAVAEKVSVLKTHDLLAERAKEVSQERFLAAWR